MKTKTVLCCRAGRFCLAFLCLLFLLAGISPQSALAQKEPDLIRVGRFPSEDQLKVDENGNYSGYGFDYLQEIARYTGWRYEFVNAPWAECLAMLERGDLDLLGAIMRSPEREERLDFSEYEMISGYGVLVTPLDNDILPSEDFQAFDGLVVGVIRGNLHADKFLAYSKAQGFTPRIRYYSNQTELDAALANGTVRAAIMTNLMRSPQLRVVATFGENDGYFATSKGNSRVLSQLNEALRRIRLSDPYFNAKLDRKYYNLQSATAVSLTREEQDFIRTSPPIPCAYIPDAFPVGSEDRPAAAQSVAADVCRLLEERTGLSFTWVYPSSESEADALLRRGEVLLIPAKIHDFNWSKKNRAFFTDPYLRGQMIMVTNRDPGKTSLIALHDASLRKRLSAVFAPDHALHFKEYATVNACMAAVLGGETDATFLNSSVVFSLMSNPRYAQLQTSPLHGFPADTVMAVSETANPLLLSILNKGLHNISATEINQLMLSRLKNVHSAPVAGFLYRHPVETLLLVAFSFIALLLALSALFFNRLANARRVAQLLYTDTLTKHPNYQALLKEADALLGQQPERYALVYMDAHHFKVLNDTYGYEAGDQALLATSKVLKDFVQKDERFARVYADIFVLLLRFDDREALKERLAGLASRLDQIAVSGMGTFNLLFGGGVYPLTRDYENLDKACDRANYAKSSLSRLLSSTFVFYDDVMRSRVLEEKELESGMLPALQRGEFVPFYQPKVNVITDKVVGAEALVRWVHPKKGCLLPSKFVPFYEKNGFIVKIDLSIFEQVCRDIRHWLDRGSPVVPISVNFSRRHMLDSSLPGKLKEIIDKYAISASLLDIEITETEELGNVDVAVDFVNALKDCGFGVSIDDYGTGYSSISVLQQLPLDTLKLDRAFILNAMKTSKARDVMRYLVEAMQSNEIKIMCEGVETVEQRDFILSLNCRFVQGYFYSRPLTREDFESYLLQHGIDACDELDCVPMTRFENNHWVGAEDFLSRTMPSWVFSSLLAPGCPVVYISPGFLEGMGYSELEFRTATDGLYINLIHPDDLPLALNRMEEERDERGDLILQYRLRKKDGSYLWIREVNKRVVIEGNKAALLSVCTDITDLVLLEKEKSRLIEAIPGGVGELLLTRNGLILQHASGRFYEIIGYTPEELSALENNLNCILYEEDVPEATKMLQELLHPKAPFVEGTFRIRRGDGSLHRISFRGVASGTSHACRITAVICNCDEGARLIGH